MYSFPSGIFQLVLYLLRANKEKQLSREVYDKVRPVGLTRPHMYGVPKIHKEGNPLRPILSMKNSPQHKLTKWLTEVIRLVLNKYSEYTVKYTSQFCERLDKFNAKYHGKNMQSLFMCSFDIKSLFTNIPLEETINICLKTLYQDDDVTKPTIPEQLLKELMLKATV